MLYANLLGYSFLLSWQQDQSFVSFIPQGTLPCQSGEELALNNQFVYFNVTNNPITMQMPGFFPLTTWVQVK